MKVEMVQYLNDHWYKITHDVEGKDEVTWCSSVMTKLSATSKPGLSSWRGSIGNEAANHKMFEAGYRGKRIHKAWESYCNGSLIRYNPTGEFIDVTEPFFDLKYQDEYLDFLKLHEWTNIVKPKNIHSEFTVYDLEHKDAGTVDNIMLIEEGEYQINGKTKLKLKKGLYIVDLKSGNNLWDDANMQIAAYATMYEKMSKVEVEGGLIIHTAAKTRTGIVGLATKLLTKDDIKADYEDFRHVAAIWERQNKNAMPKILEFPNMVKRGE